MIRTMKLDTGEELLVEIDSTEVPDKYLETEQESSSSSKDLPEGTRETNSESQLSNGGSLLKSQVQGLAKMTLDALKDLNPEEIRIEAHIKFSGDVKVVPFIASAKSDGGLKICVTWRP